MKNFNNLYTKLLENIGAVPGTTSAAGVGGTATSLQSGDFYASGDARIPKVLGAKRTKGKKGWKAAKKKMNGEAVPLIRRTFPGM